MNTLINLPNLILQNRGLILSTEIQTLNRRLERKQAISLIHRLSDSFPEPGEKDHSRKVSIFSIQFYELLGRNPGEIKNASLLHDLGKVYVDQRLLYKPSSLTNEEFAVIQEHPNYARKIIEYCIARYGSHELLTSAQRIAEFHHERFDGTGYPNKLGGTEIPEEARIVSILDVFDALISERPYRKAIPAEKVYEIMSKGDGRTKPEHFDPNFLKIFLKNYLKFTELLN